jgi:hypothetical protein
VFTTVSHFHPSLIFASRTGYPTKAEPLTELLSNGRLLNFPENIRLGWKRLKVAKTLAFYDRAIIITVRNIISQVPGFLQNKTITDTATDITDIAPRQRQRY